MSRRAPTTPRPAVPSGGTYVGLGGARGASVGAVLTAAGEAFVVERHLATLTTLRADGTPHVVPVGFSWDGAVARVITGGRSAKAGHPGRAALCQVDGARWLTLEGVLTVSSDPAVVADAVTRYAARYRTPRENPTRVALLLTVDRVLGSRGLLP